MGHEIHLLEGFILDSNPYGESGRILKILTKEFGVVSVVATGVRELKSKMRGSLDTMQLVDFEYVEGREVNRLTGIFGKHEGTLGSKTKFTNIFTIPKRRVVSNVVNFILRTVLGEVKNEVLWENFLEGLRLLDSEEKDKEFFFSFEIIWLIKILVSLGYWEEGKLTDFSEDNFEYLKNEENRKKIVEEINESIRSTHL